MKVYTIWSSTKVFYYISKSFGNAPFSIVGKIENGKIRTTPRDFLVMTIRFSLLSFLIYLNVINDFSLIKTNSFIIDKANHLANILLVFNVLFAGSINAFKRKQIWSIFKQFYEFDKQVNIMTNNSFALNNLRVCRWRRCRWQSITRDFAWDFPRFSYFSSLPFLHSPCSLNTFSNQCTGVKMEHILFCLL